MTTTYSAVATTGIYCRPGCSARPNPANVHPYPLAAAAEAAGYRACLRCRPYRTEAPLSWAGPEIVCRAVQLIVDGALDGESEVALGARLGVSSRHLRRLFGEHLGLTPDQLARSRRAHFARRLLDDTDLTVAQIAFAAGFGSVRQLNRACQDVFHATPLALRARRRVADRLIADGGLALRLPFAPPLAWDAMLRYFAARAIAGVEAVRDGVYRRTIVVDGDPGVLEITPGGEDFLVLRAHLPHWEGLIHLAQRARRIFNLDLDMAAANPAIGSDPVLGRLVARDPGLRMPGAWDPFEVGVRAIAGQQVSVTGANTLMKRLVERHGAPVGGLYEFGLTHTFPTPETLAKADLDGLGFPGARAGAIESFAAAVASGSLALDRSVPLERFLAEISGFRGLGPWTAHYLALRMGEPDAFPASDLGLRRAWERLTGAPVASRDLEERSHAWRPFRSQAAIHLWSPAAGG